MTEGYNFERAWQRERLARQQAERLLEEKTRHLYDKVLELEASQTNLAKAQDQLLQSEKLKAIGQLTAGLAHEINNPLSFCLPNLQLLAQNQQQLAAQALQKDANPQQLAWLIEDSNDLLSELQQGMQRIQDIIKQLYHYSMLGQSAPTQLSLQQIWDSVWQSFDANVLAKLDIEHCRCQTVLQVHPVEIVTALANIVDNALKAGASSLMISCDSSAANQVVMQIRDNGHGMSEQTIRQVFEPFFTTRDVGAGRGLGLTVSYSIIRQHEGTIEFQSELGVGTSCTITLAKTLASSIT